METSLHRFIGESAWGSRLQPDELQGVLQATREARHGSGEYIVRSGSPAEYWVGVMEGIVLQSVTSAEGREAILTAVSTGTWFGEGTLLKQVAWGYDAIAKGNVRLALVPVRTFHRLRDTSLPFNQFVSELLNARLSHYMGLLANERLTRVEARVAHMLASLFDPGLYPNRNPTLRISQSDIALLAGMSRQRANVALQKLQREGLVIVQRDSVTVVSVDGLKHY